MPRRVLVAENAAYFSSVANSGLCKKEPSIVWNSSAAGALHDPRNKRAWRFQSVGGAQVAVVTGRGCDHQLGGVLELSSRNQPRVTDRHRDGDGSVLIDEPSVEKRTEQGRLSGGRAQQDALHAHYHLLQVRRRPRLLSRRGGRLRRGRSSQRLSRSAGRRGLARRLAPRRSAAAGRDPLQEDRRT